IFWRDWKLPNLNVTLFDTIQNGIGPEFSADALQINITGRPNHNLPAGDVTSQVGQKFLANTNNIQKITLLLGANKNDAVPIENQFDWSGDMVISIYPLQTSTTCPTDIIPELAIDFDPSNEPLAQLSFNQTTLRDLGYVLTDVLQPVDFVLNATKVSSPATDSIIPGNYYAATIKRSGAANSGGIQVGTGNDRLANARVTLFSGVWVDVAEEDLWIQVWTDAAKVADGQAYDAGNGVQITKTTTDPITGAVIDNQARYYSLSDTGENILNAGIIQALIQESLTAQDERTGNDIFSRKQFVPSFSFVNTAGLNDLKSISEPLIIGCVQDTNPKQNTTLVKSQSLPGLAKGDNFCIVNPDPDLLSLNLLGSKLVPNISGGNDFRIFRVTLCVDGYGDVNGDGYIDAADIARASALIGESVHSPSTQAKIVDGEISTLELLRADVDGDGYITSNDLDLLIKYVTKVTNSFPVGSTFTHLCLQVQQSIGRYDGYFDCDGYIRLDGYAGINIVSPDDLTQAELIYDGYISTPMIELDSIFNTVPFPGVTYKIIAQPFWQPYLVALSSDVRLTPASFTFPNEIVRPSCSPPMTFECSDRNEIIPFCDPGRNDFFVPDNLFIGKGELLRPDGSNYKVDVEMGTVILHLPQIPLSESAIDVFDKFVADRGDGFTRAGYPAMRYSDCTTVQDADLFLNKVRFDVSLQSFAPNLDGYTDEDGYGIIVDDIIGVHMDSVTGILQLTIKDLSVDPVFLTLVTKIQILVYLKKGGWNNQVLVVPPDQIQGLISS
ncbi:MAG TPA: dockerin type I domain-containing protein, partial [Anaerovoracaceae bacterium]|nr:dockerin type I domain-containing protein [Anaerovoracaceae bacterium]